MIKNILRPLAISALFFTFALFSYLVSLWSDVWSSSKLTTTFLVLGSTHFLFRVLIYYSIVHRLHIGRVRYSLSKTLTLIHLFVALLFVLRVWLPDSNALLAAYGFVAAAIAFSVQDVFKNLIGGITILIRNLYQVGDRIEIDGSYGDVIDIGIFYTTLLEIRGWVSGDQSTGRLIKIPNGTVITKPVFNYNSDHSFIWDEVHIPVTHTSDWKKAESIIKGIIDDVSNSITTSAMSDIQKLQSKYFLTNDNTEARVYMYVTDNWISLYARYITDVRERRNTQNFVMREIMEAFSKEKKITIASESLIVDAHVKSK